jgi:Fur family ferric uptake transcriptional regulator
MGRPHTPAPNALPALSRRERDQLAGRLRRAGQRVTAQRLVILRALSTGEHVSAEEILGRVEHQAPAVNRSTVYRTLELFRDLGLVSETDLGGGVRRFELIDEQRHHHMICHRCGAIAEFDDALLEPVKQALRDRYGFTAAVDHLALFGWCAACAGQARPGPMFSNQQDTTP